MALLKCFSSLHGFLVALGVLKFAYYLIFGFMRSSMVTMERHFGWSATHTSILMIAYETGQLSVIYFGFSERSVNIPRRLGNRAMLMSCAAASYLIPVFIYGENRAYAATAMNVTNENTYCVAPDMSGNSTDTSCVETSTPAIVSLVLICISSFTFAVSSCSVDYLGYIELDRVATRSQASFYMGIIQSFQMTGPVIAGIADGFFLRIPVNPFSGTIAASERNSPNFIGAWWMGYVVVSLFTGIVGIYLRFMPFNLKNRKVSKSAKESVKDSSTENAKPRNSFKRLATNRLWVLVTLSSVLFVWLDTQILQKFVEFMYRRSTANASLESTLYTSLPNTIGILTGGLLMSKLKPPFWKITLFAATALLCVCLCNLGHIVNQCPQMEVSTTNATSCALSGKECDNSLFQPVCDEQSQFFMSPCHAGCNLTEELDMCPVTHGYCTADCPSWRYHTYVSVSFITNLLLASVYVPMTIISLRVISADLKSLGMGTQSFLVSVFGYALAPYVTGRLTDEACIQTSVQCGQRNCLLYNTDFLVKIAHGLPAVVNICTVFSVLTLAYLCKQHFTNEHEDEEEDDESLELGGGAAEVTAPFIDT